MGIINRKYGRSAKRRYPDPGGVHGVVAVDLGKRKAGVAVGWVNEVGGTSMTSCTTVHEPTGDPRLMARNIAEHVSWVTYRWNENGVHPLIWVCEWPLKYKWDPAKHENIESLQAVGRLLNWDEKYEPAEWKGQVKKDAHHKRIKKRLTALEYEFMPPLAEHDAWDAAGIWCFAVGRSKRGGVK